MAKKKSSSKPEARSLSAELGSIDFGALAGAMAGAQAQANRQMIQDALGATDTIAGRLRGGGGPIYSWVEETGADGKKEWVRKVTGHSDGNTYTAGADLMLEEVSKDPARVRALGDRMGAIAAQAEADIAPTAIERELLARAESDLALGRSLSAEQERESAQAVRAGMAARGMGTGTGALAREVLGRDSYATARDMERRNAAASTNQMVVANRQSRQGQAANLLGQTAGAYQNAQGMGLNAAQGYLAVDPYMRALGSNIPTHGAGPSASMIGQGFSSMLGYASDLYNTNYNAAYSDYLNDKNLAFSERMGNAQIAASRAAGNQGMFGSLMGGGMTALGAIGAGALIGF